MGPQEFEQVNQPKARFQQALDEIQTVLSTSPEVGMRYYDSPMDLSLAAQTFDVVTSEEAAIAPSSRQAITQSAARRLYSTINAYQGPQEIKDIYHRLYDLPLSELLGENETKE